MSWVAYHDRNSAYHQTQFDSLSPKGWRLISISVYGSRGNELYAAVWVDRAGPAWSAVHGVDAAGYQAAFNTAVAGGFIPVLLSVTGPSNDPVFAGTFEQSSLPVPLTRFGLVRGAVSDVNTIDHWTDQARTNGWYPTSISIYGTGSDLRYAGIWISNPDGICWTTDGLADSATSYQARFDALAPVRARPAHVAVSPDGQYASIFRDDQLDGWVARHNLDSNGYQSEFNTLTVQGLMPVSVQAGGSGSGARFAALFARDDTRLPLIWQTPTGPVAVAAIDTVMHDAMQRHRIRGASLALVRDSRLIYARGYALAEAGYPTIEPTTFFRQASCSKTIVTLAIYKLIQDGALALNTPIQNHLSLQTPSGGSPAASFSQVTVQHLLEHKSGLPTNPYSVEPNVVAAFNAAGDPSVHLPVNGRQTDRYMITLPASMPPATAAYNNWGYMLLAHLVMAVTHETTLIRALDTLLFRPLGITRIREATTRVEDQPADEVPYHPTFFSTGPSVMEPDRRLRATGYGGWWNLERDDAGGGLSGAAVDVARLLAMLDVRIANPVLEPATIANLFTLAQAGGGHGFDTGMVLDASAGTYYGMKGGDIPESNQNCVRYKTGDISMVVCWNRHDIAEGAGGDSWWYPDFPDVLKAARLNTWGTADLFPSYGMSSFGTGSGCLSLFAGKEGSTRWKAMESFTRGRK